jgi:hypothetical protein
MNRIMCELGVARQAELLRFTSRFLGVDHLLVVDRARIARGCTMWSLTWSA